MNMHQYTWSRENSGLILFNSLMCLDCQPGTMCEHFSMGEINYNDNRLKLASPKEKKTLKRSQKVSVVADEIKKPKVVPNRFRQNNILTASSDVTRDERYMCYKPMLGPLYRLFDHASLSLVARSRLHA
ncbi:Protein of unknown function, partial [Cotesia congregata]